MADRIGLRAITMQQPYAAAMAAGRGLYTRRGKATKFPDGGEWIAVHCGQNDEHLQNHATMQQIREEWPECPSDGDLRAQQRCLLGVVHMVDGNVAASTAAKTDAFLANYDCCKPVAWRADAARSCERPLPYPKGNLQVWHLTQSGFAASEDAAVILELVGSAVDVKAEVKTEMKEEVEPEVKAEAEAKAAKVPRGEKRAGPPGGDDAEPKAEPKARREIAGLGPTQTYRPAHRGATVAARKSAGPRAPRRPLVP